MLATLVNSKGDGENPDAPASGRTPRMSAEQRERHIVSGAISFFAERGFDAQMRDLAKAIGVTHTLVYHYFKTKQDLVDRVFKEVFEGRWNPQWEQLLDDRHLSVPDKLTRFYVEYARTVLTREFVRILLFSGLTDHSITDRFFPMLGQRLFPRLIRETRLHRGSNSRARTTAREHELLMALHGGIFYGGLRRYVYAQALHPDMPEFDDPTVIRDQVRGYLAASRILLPAAAKPAAAASAIRKRKAAATGDQRGTAP
jgi:AcrR family transcriptional regulator